MSQQPNQRKGAVLITGAAGGIGNGVVTGLADAGYHVFAGVRTPGTTDRQAGRRLQPGVEPIELDVASTVSVDTAAQAVSRKVAGLGGLHAVVNLAGLIVQGPVELVSDEDLRRQFEVNVYGPITVMRAFLPLLRTGTASGPGRVVNISAPTARTAVPFLGPISASKAALESISDAARVELAQWRIPVVIIEPGAMDTPIFGKAESAASAALAAAPSDRVALYQPALSAVARASAKQKRSPASVAVTAIVHAVQARKPKARYVAGRDASTLIMLSRLPTGTRDRLLAGNLGLSKLSIEGAK